MLPATGIRHKLRSQIPALFILAALLGLTQLAGAASYTWNVSSGNWSTPGSWTPTTGAGGPLATDSVIFGNTDVSSSPTTVNNTVDLGFDGIVTNFTVNSVASGTYVYDVTQIPSGQTLTVRGSMVVGEENEGAGTYATYEYMVGGGTLNVTAPSLIVQNYGSASGANDCAYLNMSGLTNFIYNNPNGIISMEGFVPSNYASGSQGTRQGGSMLLAACSNSITAAAINLGTSAVAQAGPSGQLASGVANQLTLGPGTNIINASSIVIAAQKNPYTITNSGGGLRMRGVTGADSDSSVNITLGDRNVGGGTGIIVGNLLLNGCAVDIKAGTLIVGQNNGGAPSSAADGGTGLFQFDTGTVSANSVIMADNTSANNGANLAECNGTIDVGANGTLLIGAGQLFDLASATSTGPSTGTLIISNGLVNCQGPIAMGPLVGANSSGSIVFLTGGTLNMGPNSYVGVVTNPVTTLTLTNCVLSVSIPSVSYTNICVNTLNWPTPDTNLTISVAAMPAGIFPGAVFPFLNFVTMNGTFNNPHLSLPPGVLGNLSLAPGGNTMYLTITAGVGPGQGGVNQLTNSSFESFPLGSNWTATAGATVVTSNGVSTYPNTGTCTSDTRLIQVLSGTNAAELTGSFVAGGSTNSWSQSVPLTASSTLTPGATLTAGGFTYVAHENIMSGADSFYYELDFKSTNGTLISSYESTIVTNLTCGGPNLIPLDSWALMAITNQMQVSGGINTGVVVTNVASGVITVPPQTATALFKAVFIQRNATDSGAVYFDGANLGYLNSAVPPVISAVTPNGITLCTNTTLSCTVTSAVTTISSVQVIVQTNSLGALTTVTITNNVGTPGLTVTGLGTSSATISYALVTNTVYSSVVVNATDADGITVSSTAAFDTLVPALVVEASDFNYSSGQFMDTPANGGLALYVGQVGTPQIDENKAARSSTQSYYRPADAVIIQAAAPASATEQKFVTAAANGDTNDVELEVGYNTPGDWLNYTRTFGPGGSAPAGTYNVWCYLATDGTGVESTFSELTTPNATQTAQTTNVLGNFGSATFSDGSYSDYVYVPLLDQYGNVVTVTVTNGEQTFKNTVVGNPNIGFYLFVPVAPVYTPVLRNVSPNGSTPFQSTNQFTFTVGPANGASITTNGIGLTINGVPVTSGLSFSQSGGSWTVNYGIQSNALYTAVINVTNTSGLASSYTVSFDTFSVNNYEWEAVDYDYSTNNGAGWVSGLFINNPVPTGDLTSPTTGTLATNSYYGYPAAYSPGVDPYGLGALAQQGIDINFTNLQSGADAAYRADGVGSQVATDYLRPKFLAAQTNFNDTTICPFNIGYFNAGNWLNYTRTWPTNYYSIWGRLAGGNGAFSGTTLGVVTSGVGTSSQTVNTLGSFSDPNAAGWQTYHWVPLLDNNGNQVVVQLGGQATLRVTSGNNLNAEFFMLAPASAPALVFDISATEVGGNIQISIPTQTGHSYTLWTSGSLTAPNWTQVGGAITGDGTVHVVSQSSASSQGYYEVIAE